MHIYIFMKCADERSLLIPNSIQINSIRVMNNRELEINREINYDLCNNYTNVLW